MKRTLRMRVDGQEFTVDVERTGNTLSIDREGEHYTVELLDTGSTAGGPETSGQTVTGGTGGSSTAAAGGAAAGGPGGSPAATGAGSGSSPAAGDTPAAEKPPVSIPQTSGDPSQVGGAGGAVAAPMTGVVKELLVAPGDTVGAGERIVIMEAMKMDIEVSAPRGGTVAEVFVKAGENVKEQQSLLRISDGI